MVDVKGLIANKSKYIEYVLITFAIAMMFTILINLLESLSKTEYNGIDRFVENGPRYLTFNHPIIELIKSVDPDYMQRNLPFSFEDIVGKRSVEMIVLNPVSDQTTSLKDIFSSLIFYRLNSSIKNKLVLLEMWLEKQKYGNITGFKKAARYLYTKEPNQLTINECATLLSTIQNGSMFEKAPISGIFSRMVDSVKIEEMNSLRELDTDYYLGYLFKSGMQSYTDIKIGEWLNDRLQARACRYFLVNGGLNGIPYNKNTISVIIYDTEGYVVAIIGGRGREWEPVPVVFGAHRDVFGYNKGALENGKSPFIEENKAMNMTELGRMLANKPKLSKEYEKIVSSAGKGCWFYSNTGYHQIVGWYGNLMSEKLVGFAKDSIEILLTDILNLEREYRKNIQNVSVGNPIW